MQVARLRDYAVHFLCKEGEGCNLSEVVEGTGMQDYGSGLAADFLERLKHLLAMHRTNFGTHLEWYKDICIDATKNYLSKLPKLVHDALLEGMNVLEVDSNVPVANAQGTSAVSPGPSASDLSAYLASSMEAFTVFMDSLSVSDHESREDDQEERERQ